MAAFYRQLMNLTCKILFYHKNWRKYIVTRGNYFGAVSWSVHETLELKWTLNGYGIITTLVPSGFNSSINCQLVKRTSGGSKEISKTSIGCTCFQRDNFCFLFFALLWHTPKKLIKSFVITTCMFIISMKDNNNNCQAKYMLLVWNFLPLYLYRHTYTLILTFTTNKKAHAISVSNFKLI